MPPATFLSARQMRGFGTRRRVLRSSPPGRYAGLLLSGCQDTESSIDAFINNRSNGAFTYMALRELRKLPATATYTEWFRRIRKNLPSQEFPQSPNLFGSSAMKRWKVFA